MKLIKRTIALLSVALLSLPAIGSSQKEPVESHPGYLNLDSILVGSEENITTEVILHNFILKMVAKVTKNKEPEFSKMLNAIELIRVVEYEFDAANAKETLEKADSLVDYLNSDGGWDTLVRNREDGDYTNISIQSDREDHIYALAVVTWDSEDLTVVNVVGDIDLELLARLGEKFDIEELEDFETPSTDE